jgi:hypothetical protein
MRQLRFNRNAFGHGLGLLVSLVFVGMGMVGIGRHGLPDSWDVIWSMLFFVGTASVFAWQLKLDILPPPKSAGSPAERQSPCSVVFDDQKIQSFYNGNPREVIAWDEVENIFILIEDDFLPFPYWYIGNGKTGIRMPNDAIGGVDLMNEFGLRLPGFARDETYRIISNAMGAMEGMFMVWKRLGANESA